MFNKSRSIDQWIVKIQCNIFITSGCWLIGLLLKCLNMIKRYAKILNYTGSRYYFYLPSSESIIYNYTVLFVFNIVSHILLVAHINKTLLSFDPKVRLAAVISVKILPI